MMTETILPSQEQLDKCVADEACVKQLGAALLSNIANNAEAYTSTVPDKRNGEKISIPDATKHLRAAANQRVLDPVRNAMYYADALADTANFKQALREAGKDSSKDVLSYPNPLSFNSTICMVAGLNIDKLGPVGYGDLAEEPYLAAEHGLNHLCSTVKQELQTRGFVPKK